MNYVTKSVDQDGIGYSPVQYSVFSKAMTADAYQKRGNESLRRGRTATLLGTGASLTALPAALMAPAVGAKVIRAAGKASIAQKPRKAKLLGRVGNALQHEDAPAALAMGGGYAGLGSMLYGTRKTGKGIADQERARLMRAGIIKTAQTRTGKLREMTANDKKDSKQWGRASLAATGVGAGAGVGAGLSAAYGLNQHTKLYNMQREANRAREAQNNVRGRAVAVRGPYTTPNAAPDLDALRMKAYKISRRGSRSLRAVGPLLGVSAASTLAGVGFSQRKAEIDARQSARRALVRRYGDK